MTTVNTKIHDVYWNGRQAAVDDILAFLDDVSEIAMDQPLPRSVSTGRYLQAIAELIRDHSNGTLEKEATR